ncbi:hypothetical protein MUK42_20360 [Musa troglodytarum]|uniref:Uncharacterized protein n=1 Tax=Musa troglodytarum TaxID=320322 RepID=A0A9E7EM79_9LILI|nr:hypothetical protein MUK42_20360 [Musa troglodytarum]
MHSSQNSVPQHSAMSLLHLHENFQTSYQGFAQQRSSESLEVPAPDVNQNSVTGIVDAMVNRTYDMVSLEQRGPTSPFNERVSGRNIWVDPWLSGLPDHKGSTFFLIACDDRLHLDSDTAERCDSR